MPHSSDRDAVRITSAPVSPADEMSVRQRRYLISMAIRTLCVILAVLFHESWLLWIFIAGAVFLPYVAVVQANQPDRRDTDPGLREVDDNRRMLGP